MTLSLVEARRRLRNTVEDYIRLETELRALENTNYRVCMFGSARIPPQDPMYHRVFHIAQELSGRRIDVVTGGGPGLMEAANRGVLAAKRQRSRSYGLTLDLPTLSEPPNPHLDFTSAHKRFSSRLDEFLRLSHAVVVAPGGIGTMLELMYVWQQLQLRTAQSRPMILLGRKFWEGFLTWMRDVPAEMRLIDLHDLECIQVVDTAEEVLAIIDASHAEFLAERQEADGLENVSVEVETERMAEAANELAEDLDRQMQTTTETLQEILTSA